VVVVKNAKSETIFADSKITAGNDYVRDGAAGGNSRSSWICSLLGCATCGKQNRCRGAQEAKPERVT
jgi:hypothetical protein